MAASQTSTKSSSIGQILHLVFTILSIAVLSYKVYHVESELFIRNELSFRDDNNGMTVQLSTAATVNKHSRDRGSDGKSRVSHKISKETAADCIQKALSELQVKNTLNETGKLICMRAPPRFTSKIPKSISVRQGNKLSLNISTYGNPAPKITWFLQGRKPGNQSQFKITAETFEIMQVRFEDQGKITCHAENVFGVREAHVKLIVFGPPRFPTSPPGQVIGFLGKATELQCDVVGYPTPKVKWNRTPPAPLPQGRSAVRDNSLYINNTEIGDGGVYLCTVTNKHGMIIHGTFLKVEPIVLPMFSTTTPSSISVSSIRESLRVNCSAKGSPLPSVTWYKNGVTMHVINNVTKDEFTSELVIPEFQPADQATYRCVARNMYNDTVETSIKISLINCGHPGRTENAVLIDSNHWVGEYVRYLCHPGYTMFGPAVRRCLPSGKWSGNLVQCTDKPECVRHMLLEDYTRRVGSTHTYDRCDRDLAEGWYRFLDRRYMNNQCVKTHKCNTDRPGYLTGGHPSVEQGRVTRKVCFGYKGSSCCQYSTYVTVRNCGSFYVYKLKPTPTCDLRYCTS